MAGAPPIPPQVAAPRLGEGLILAARKTPAGTQPTYYILRGNIFDQRADTIVVPTNNAMQHDQDLVSRPKHAPLSLEWRRLAEGMARGLPGTHPSPLELVGYPAGAFDAYNYLHFPPGPNQISARAARTSLALNDLRQAPDRRTGFNTVTMCTMVKSQRVTRLTPGAFVGYAAQAANVTAVYDTAITESCNPWFPADVQPPQPRVPRSVVFPLIGPGDLNYDPYIAADAALRALIAYFTTNALDYLSTGHIYIVIPSGGPRSAAGRKYQALRHAWNEVLGPLAQSARNPGPEIEPILL